MHALETIISINEKASKEQLSKQNKQIEEAIKKLKDSSRKTKNDKRPIN